MTSAILGTHLWPMTVQSGYIQSTKLAFNSKQKYRLVKNFTLNVNLLLVIDYFLPTKDHDSVEGVEKREFGETGLCTVCFARTEDKVSEK
jgi:hypothetical protein